MDNLIEVTTKVAEQEIAQIADNAILNVENVSEVQDELEIVGESLNSVVDGLNSLENSEFLLAKGVVTGKDSYTVPIQFNGEDLVDVQSLKSAVARHITGISPKVNSKNFSAYVRDIRNQAERKTVFRYAGHNGNCWSMVNALVDYEKKIIVPYKKKVEEKEWKSIENTYLYSKTECTPILKASSQQALESIASAFKSMLASYTNPCIPCCAGAILGTCFWDIFLKVAQGFPTVILTGESQSGKTAFMRMMAALFGLFGNDAFIGGHSTTTSILRMLSTRNNIPLFLNEIEQVVFEKLDSFVKAVYDKTGRAKCNGVATETASVRTAFAGTSNYFFPRLTPELVSRVIWANMRKDEFNPNKFGFFSEESLQNLSLAIPLIVLQRNKVESLYTSIYLNLAKIYPTKHDRQIRNVAISCTMWELVNQIFNENFVDTSAMASNYLNFFESYCDCGQQNGDNIILEITKMLQNNALEFVKDFGATKENTSIKLPLNRFLEKRNAYFHRKNDELTRAKFTALVENDKRFNLKSENFKPYGRAISIDISENTYLQELIESAKIQSPFYAMMNCSDEDSANG